MLRLFALALASVCVTHFALAHSQSSNHHSDEIKSGYYDDRQILVAVDDNNGDVPYCYDLQSMEFRMCGVASANAVVSIPEWWELVAIGDDTVFCHSRATGTFFPCSISLSSLQQDSSALTIPPGFELAAVADSHYDSVHYYCRDLATFLVYDCDQVAGLKGAAASSVQPLAIPANFTAGAVIQHSSFAHGTSSNINLVRSIYTIPVERYQLLKAGLDARWQIFQNSHGSLGPNQ